MRSEASFTSRVRQYLEALGGRGQLLTLLGLLPTLADIVALAVGYTLDVPSWLAGLCFIAAFGWANLRVFEARTSSQLEIDVKEYSAELNKWLDFSHSRVSVKPEISISLHARLNVYNHSQRATHVRLALESVESEWPLAKEPSEFKVQVRRTTSRGDTSNANPFSLEASEMNDDVSMRAEILFRVPDTQKGFEYLGSLSRMVLTFRAEQGGRKPIPLLFKCDVAHIRKTIEETLIVRLQHMQLDGNMARRFIQGLRQYWNVH